MLWKRALTNFYYNKYSAFLNFMIQMNEYRARIFTSFIVKETKKGKY